MLIRTFTIITPSAKGIANHQRFFFMQIYGTTFSRAFSFRPNTNAEKAPTITPRRRLPQNERNHKAPAAIAGPSQTSPGTHSAVPMIKIPRMIPIDVPNKKIDPQTTRPNFIGERISREKKLTCPTLPDYHFLIPRDHLSERIVTTTESLK